MIGNVLFNGDLWARMTGGFRADIAVTANFMWLPRQPLVTVALSS